MLSQPLYARKYRHDFPHNKHLFEFRQRKSMDLQSGGFTGGVKIIDARMGIIEVPRDSKIGKSILKSEQSKLNFK